MILLILLLVICGIIAAVASYFVRNKELKPVEDLQPSCDTCSGNDDRCMHDCMIEAAIKEPEYFDDEELDAFIGRSEDSYSEEEVEMFSNVLHTMKPEEVGDWMRSLTLRNINLPLSLRDEVIMLINES